MTKQAEPKVIWQGMAYIPLRGKRVRCRVVKYKVYNAYTAEVLTVGGAWTPDAWLCDIIYTAALKSKRRKENKR